MIYVLLPKNPLPTVEYSAKELHKYLTKACSESVEITQDCKCIEKNGYVISLGETELVPSEWLKENNLDNTRYRIIPKDNVVFLIAKDGCGVLYAAYGLLEETIEFKAYAPDEIQFQNKPFEIPKKTIDYIPDIPDYSIGFFETRKDYNTAALYKMPACFEGGMNADGDWWGIWAHTHFKLLPPEKYAEEHPDWYNENKTQLCLSNEEMHQEFIKNLKECILEKENARYFMVSAEDTPHVCRCEKCQKGYDKYTESGVMLQFVGKVAKEIKEWQQKTIPNREITLVILAYFDVTYAPSRYDNKTDSFIADSSFELPDNVAVMFAPLEMCYGHPINDPTCPINRWYYEAFRSWEPIAKKMFVWSYCTNFSNFLVPLNSFDSMQENYKIYKKRKVSYVFEHGNICDKLSPFQKLRIYVQSKLLQNVEKPWHSFAEEFIEKYYKTAAKPMQKYFDLVNENFANIEDEYKKKNKHFPTFVYLFKFDEEKEYPLTKQNYWKKTFTGKTILSSKFFPKNFINMSIELLEDALSKAVEEEIYNRVLFETIPIKVISYLIYAEEKTKEERIELIEEMKKIVEKFEINQYGENGDRIFKNLFNQWEK